MKYEIYCDESCVEAIFDKDAHTYSAIGGIWIPADSRQKLKASLNDIKAKYNVKGEVKWNKVSPMTVEMYKDIISYFFSSCKIRFRVIILESSKIDNKLFNEDCGELGFYKFYYQLISHWLSMNNEYSIFLDYKVNGNRHRVNELGKILNCSSNSDVFNAQALPSNESVALQLADIHTGAVTAKFNAHTTSKAKLTIIEHIESLLGHEIMQTQRDELKFNVFNINLRHDW